jgi:hypothetical protein
MKSKSREIESINIPHTSGLQGQKMHKEQSIRTNTRIQEMSGDSEKKCCECWENHMQTPKEDEWIDNMSYRNCLHNFHSLYKAKCVDCS